MARKKWRLVYPGEFGVDEFPSKVKADEFVEALRSSWAAGAPGSGSTVTVQVDRGQGWETHEFIDFAEETAA